MNVVKTAIEGVAIIEPRVFKDSGDTSSRVFKDESLMTK